MSRVLLNKWDEDPSFVNLQGDFNRISAQLVTGLEDSQRSFFMAALHDRSDTSSLVLTSDMVKAEKIFEEVSAFLPPEDIYIFPAKDFFYAGEVLTQSKEILEQRIRVLERLSLGKKVFVIAPAAALLSKLVPPDAWVRNYVQVKVGITIDRDYLSKKLVEMGYERADITESQGVFSVRGDIVDVFPFHTTQPLRISFFDEEVESLKYFDSETQRSLESIQEHTIFPAREIIIESSVRQQGIKAVNQELEKVCRKLKAKNQEEAADRLRTRTESHLVKLENETYFEEIDQYISYFYSRLTSLTDYFPKESLLFWDEPENVVSLEESLLKDLRDYQSSLLAQGDILPGQASLYWNLQEILNNLQLRIIALSVLSRRVPYVKADSVVNINSRSTPSFMSRLDIVKEEIGSFWEQGYEVFLMCDGEQKAEEMEELLRENELPALNLEKKSQDLLEMKKNDVEVAVEGMGEVINLEEERTKKGKRTGGNVKIINGRLGNGFVLPSLNLVVLVDNDIIPRVQKKKRWSKKQKKDREAITDFQELATGDLVVHEQHGIGRYMGMRTLEVDGVKRDYLYIQYSGEDKLYLPVEQIDTIQKYIGGEEKEPKIYSLGSQEWNRVKNRVKASVQELARELLSLYAAREAAQGYAFSPDHRWQKDFEEYFPYEETPDQLSAIEKVKEDMENTKPMDRLLCGDVGYGKTEVALRAAFKAVMDGKQVALLVPTTILAQQHYTTFLERFEQFPVNIELLSRFRTQKEQREVIKGVKAGVVDMVIGTHRLVSKDVKFKDLGLIIIDEEHRFGVRHKEKLKMMRQQVDVLSMTATPIPRTLHMALSGARDLSVIDTPPEDRYPIQTYVVEYSEHMIKEAIQRELGRGGQVFFIYNRVQTITQFAEKMRKLLPDVRIVAAHGQMQEDKLEEVMNDFLEKKYDILISTTIVEAGLDIPNVNTMIVYDADNFGLAQLYQLRGRVGRSSRLAYCYLTYRKDKIMTEEAVKRLKAIKEFTELGSGFKIALRDLKIRGAGNILGPEQHGFMVAVGYELYCRLLQQAVDALQGGEAYQESKAEEPKIDININAYLPPSYVPSQQQKIELYRRIASLEDDEELNDMAEELEDRFGRMQSPVENLLLVMKLRQLAREKHVESIEEQKGEIVMKFHQEREFQSEKLWQLVHDHRRNVSIHAGKSVSLKVKGLRQQKEKERLNFLINILQQVS